MFFWLIFFFSRVGVGVGVLLLFFDVWFREDFGGSVVIGGVREGLSWRSCGL